MIDRIALQAIQTHCKADVLAALTRAADTLADVGDHESSEIYAQHATAWQDAGHPTAPDVDTQRRYEDTAQVRRRDPFAARRADYETARRTWHATPKDERRRLALDTLGDDALTVRELLNRMRTAAPELADALHESHARRLLFDLVARGEVHREGERWKNRTRYRYRRASDLRGPIADLDRQFP